MKILLTGGTGYVGSRVARRLIERGHHVRCVVRASSAAKLPRGIEPFVADLADHTRIAEEARRVDAIVNTGFPSHGSDWAAAVATEAQLMTTLADALAGSGKSVIVSNGSAFYGNADGRFLTEDESIPEGPVKIRADATAPIRSIHGARGIELRLASFVYGAGGSVFVPALFGAAKRTRRSIYVGDGTNRLSAVHVEDAASAYIFALENAEASGVFHVASDEAPPMRDLAAAIAVGAEATVERVSADEAARITDPFTALFLSLDNALSSHRARCVLGWAPAGYPGLLWDVAFGSYANG